MAGIDHHAKLLIGDLVLMVAKANAAADALAEENERLKAELLKGGEKAEKEPSSRRATSR